MKRANIYDVAEKAGVSTATITRFFNGGYIKIETRDRIQSVVDALGYVRSHSAVRLARNSHKKIGVIAPKVVDGDDFWLYHNGMNHARSVLLNHGTEMLVYSWSWWGNKEAKPIQTVHDLFETIPDALLIPPGDEFTTPHFLSSLPEKLCVAAIEKDIEIPQRKIFFASEDLQGCRSAAKLMAGACPEDGVVLVLTASTSSQSIQERSSAFARELGALAPSMRLIDETRLPGVSLQDYLKEKLRPGETLHGVFVPNKEVRKAAQSIREFLGYKPRMVIGFDWTPNNVHALHTGEVDYLLHLRLDLAVYRSLLLMNEWLNPGGAEAYRTCRIPLEIVDRYTAPGVEERMKQIPDL